MLHSSSFFLSALIVAQAGFEPTQTAPKTVVLPLHHWANSFATAKVIKIAISQDDFTKKNRLSKQSIFHMFMKTIPSFSP